MESIFCKDVTSLVQMGASITHLYLMQLSWDTTVKDLRDFWSSKGFFPTVFPKKSHCSHQNTNPVSRMMCLKTESAIEPPKEIMKLPPQAICSF